MGPRWLQVKQTETTLCPQGTPLLQTYVGDPHAEKEIEQGFFRVLSHAFGQHEKLIDNARKAVCPNIG
eukprot:6589462-Heterocapsa_arctica.AAC.1